MIKSLIYKLPPDIQSKVHFLINLIKRPKHVVPNLLPNTFFGASLYISLRRPFIFKNLLLRKNFLKTLPELKGADISSNEGYKILNLSSNKKFISCIKYVKQKAKNIDFNALKKESKKPFLITLPIDLDDEVNRPIRELILDPRFIKPISMYLGGIPIISYAGIWYSPNEQMAMGRSQEYHLDEEDSRQVKCFIPLEDITIDSGPVTLIPANESYKLFCLLKKHEGIKRKNQKIKDSTIFKYTDYKNELKLTGKFGECILVDTCRCYHYGSRPSPKPRLLLQIQFNTIFSREIPLLSKSNPKFSQHPNTSIEKFIFSDYHRAKNTPVNKMFKIT